MELELEHSQQGSSHEVSVSTEGVEELKRIVRIKGVKKEALHTTLGRNQSQHQTALRIRQWRYNLIPAESRFKTSCSINKDTFMMKAQANTFLCFVGLSRHYTLDEDTYPRFVHKNEEGWCLLSFLCYVFYGFVVLLLTILLFHMDMNLFTFIYAPDPTKVRVVERERKVDEPRLLDTTIGRTVPLLLVAPNHADIELEASVEMLFNEGGNGTQTNQGDSTRGGPDADIEPIVEAANILTEDAAPEDHETPSRTSVATSVSTTPECEDEDHTDSAEVDSLVKSSTPVMTTATTITSMVDSTLVVKERTVKLSLFAADSSSAGGADPNTSVFSDIFGSDFLVGGIRTVIDPDTDLQKVYVPQWSMTNGSRLDDARVCREMVDKFAPPKFFVFFRGMKHDQLFTEFNDGAARKMSLSAEAKDREIENLKAQLLLKEAEAAKAMRLHAQTSNLKAVEKSLQDEVNSLKWFNVILEKERDALDVKVTDLEFLVVGKERDLTDLNAHVTFVKSQNDSLADQVHKLEVSSTKLQEKITVYDNCMEQLEKFQDDQMKVINDKFDNLHTDLMEMTLHLKERIYPHLLTIISGRMWLLTHGMELAIAKCLNSPEYLSALRFTIGKALEKGMQYGLAAEITHDKEGKVLSDATAPNPFAKAEYISTLRQIQDVNFPLLAELKSNKDDSVKAIMEILCLEDPVAEKLRLNELQPNIDQLMVPIHSSSDKAIIGATALSLALDASSMEGMFDAAPTTVITMALSTTLALTGTVNPISIDDYEFVDTDDQAGADGNAKL
nr:hypothetical protein [Tanacetum cinerariifolium]